MADPSLLLSESGQSILEQGLPPLVVSQTFLEVLHDGIDIDFENFRADNDGTDPGSFVDRIRPLTLDLPGYSYRTALDEDSLDEGAIQVLDRILENDDAMADIHADQWAFLNSHSWLGSQSRRALDTFRNAGAVMIEVGKDIGIRMLEEVIPMEDRPNGVGAGLIVLGAVKWLVVGGAGFGASALGGAVGGPAGGLLGEKIIGGLARGGTKRILFAIDP